MPSRPISCRTAIGAGAAASIAAVGATYAQGSFPTPEPIAISTPDATPNLDLDGYDGDLRALNDSPWEVEGKLISFNGVIETRQIAPDGMGIPVGSDGKVFLALLYVQVPDLGDSLFVATNASLESIEELHTAHFEGIYAGVHGPGWTVPLIIANVVEPVNT